MTVYRWIKIYDTPNVKNNGIVVAEMEILDAKLSHYQLHVEVMEDGNSN